MNNLYFPAIKRYDVLSDHDLFAFYPVDPSRTKFEGSIDGLPRKTTFKNIIDYITDNIVVNSSVAVSSGGTSVGSFDILNFVGLTLTDAGSGQVNITLPTSTDTNLANTNLELLEERTFDVGGQSLLFKTGITPHLLISPLTDTYRLGDATNYMIVDGVNDYIGFVKNSLVNTLVYNDRLEIFNKNFRIRNLNHYFELNPSALTSSASYSLPSSASQGFLFNDASNNLLWTNIITPNTEHITVACSDETTDLTTGTSIVTFRCPFNCTVSNITGYVNTASVGADITIQIKVNGVNIFSSLLTIDATEKSSTTSASPYVLVVPNLPITANNEITVDIVTVGSSTAGAGLKINFELIKV